MTAPGRESATIVPPIALTMGEPAGIGGEISLKAWLRRGQGVPAFFLVDDPERLESLARALGLEVPLTAIDSPEGVADLFPGALPVLPRKLNCPSVPGTLAGENSTAVIASIAASVELVTSGRAGAVVTNPVHKLSLYESGFDYPGHTEYLAALAGSEAEPVMMLASDRLRVVPVSRHVGLGQAVEMLSRELIVETARITFDALSRDFGLDHPRMVVAGLNPHAGEGGNMGTEEIDIIAPAVDELRRAGFDVNGPVPPDTLFHPRARENYDAALCMYHDQALIPIKTIDFDGAVNVTLGLPFIRTSPDHGTALDIAGKGVAREDSLIQALKLAALMRSNRAARGAG